MAMDDVYHWARWYVRGELDDEAVVAEVRSIWEEKRKANPGGPLDRLWLSTDDHSREHSFAVERLGGPADAVFFLFNERPRDDEARACWGPAAGDLVDVLIGLPNLEAWVLVSDEDHATGIWTPQGAVINTVVGMEGWSMREPLALMLIDRFEAHGVPYELVDLGGTIPI